MTTKTGVQPYNTFVRGLITEANVLTYPEGASKDELNFKLNRDGSRQRRLGIDFEDSYSLGSAITANTAATQAITAHEWKNADNNGNNNFGVVQIGTTIYFYDLDATAISGGLKSFSVDLNDFYTGYSSNFGNEPIQVASGRGALFVVSKDTEPFYIEYDSNTDTISTTEVSFLIRDFEGLESTSSGVAISDTTRPAVLDRSHEYNLKNQGYDSNVIKNASASSDDAVNVWYNGSTYPGNTDLFILGFTQAVQTDGVTPIPNKRHWRGSFIRQSHKLYSGNTTAPKGHFKLDPFNVDRNNPVDQRTTWLSAGDVDTNIDKNRPSTVAFFAGRVWYSGVASEFAGAKGTPNNHNVFFSQILSDLRKAGNCFQDGDPTAESGNELLPNDGGVINIPEVGTIKRLLVIQQYLVVFADNGVWSISGDVDSGFTATTPNVRKISEVGVLSPHSIVAVEGKGLYWSDGGIYAVQGDELSILQVVNITEQTIQTFYNSIPYNARKYAWGNYDPFQKKVQWLYTDDSNFNGESNRFKYNSILELDTVLQAFSKHSISGANDGKPYVCGFLQSPSSSAITFTLDVTDSTGAVVTEDSTGEDVTVERASRSQDATSTNTYYLTMVPDASNFRPTFSKFKSLTFLDWYSYDSTGTNYTSYLETGVELFGDMVRDKRAHRLWMYFLRTETGYQNSAVEGDLSFLNPSGCYVSTRWDFSTSGTSGKWSPKKQMYRMPPTQYIPTDTEDYDHGYDTIVAEDSLRGNGKGVSLYIESETGKDMVLLGWALQASLTKNP